MAWIAGIAPVRKPTESLVHTGKALLHQQLWRLGRDVQRPAGNLLLARGFERIHDPTGRGCSHYRLSEHGVTVSLWGWGAAWCRAEGGVFLRRYEFRPRWLGDRSIPRECWDPADLGRVPIPRRRDDVGRSARLVAELCRWFADYERHAALAAGADWVEGSLVGWKHVVCPGAELPGRWERLACQLETTNRWM